ncbi:hypothetical protein K0M31_019101 [Melipona bicolor]|uniref:Uncharacterized protein n=1 Tax=Melipona bicolor TaxID=60889 RepID=A0AA40G1N0_9HYME|nr:hypothetical protein K0M31_019101 [Melipona bicolor]
MEDEGLQGAGGRRDFERGSLCSRRPPALASRRERAGDGEASLRRRVEEPGALEGEVGESEEKPGGGSSSGAVSEGGLELGRRKTEGELEANPDSAESRYIRKYKSIQDGAEERCLACR